MRSKDFRRVLRTANKSSGGEQEALRRTLKGGKKKSSGAAAVSKRKARAQAKAAKEVCGLFLTIF